MADGTVEEIGALPSQFESLAAEFPNVAQRLQSEVAPSIVPGMPPSILFLRNADVRTRFYFARQGQKVVFFFGRRDLPVRVVLDASIGFRLKPVPPETLLPVISPESLVQTVIVPPFFFHLVSEKRREEYAKALEMDPGSLVFLKLDQGLAAIANWEEARKLRLAWRLHDTGADESPSGPIAVFPGKNGWTWESTWPFLALARTIGAWANAGFESGTPRAFQHDLWQQGTVISRIMNSLVEAWCVMANSAGLRNAPQGNADWTQVRYKAEDSVSRVLLRLTPDGEIAEKDEDDPFQLLASLRFSEEEANSLAQMCVAVGPPDFLASGPMHKKFLDQLEQKEVVEKISSCYKKEPDDAVVRKLERFLGAARHTALVFRVKRGRDLTLDDVQAKLLAGDKKSERDTDLVLLQGPWGDVAVAQMILRFECTVGAPPESLVTIYPDSLKMLFRTQPDLHWDDDLPNYFKRLLKHLCDWFGVLK